MPPRKINAVQIESVSQDSPTGSWVIPPVVGTDHPASQHPNAVNAPVTVVATSV